MAFRARPAPGKATHSPRAPAPRRTPVSSAVRPPQKDRTDRSPVEGGRLVKRGQEGPLEGDTRAVRRPSGHMPAQAAHPNGEPAPCGL